MADAALEGVAMRKETMPAEAAEEGTAEAEEKYLGEATLAKIRSGELAFEEDLSTEDEDETSDEVQS